jgi:hypothetical protein
MRNILAGILFFAASFLFIGAAQSEGTTLSDVMSGKAQLPKTMLAKELDASWISLNTDTKSSVESILKRLDDNGDNGDNGDKGDNDGNDNYAQPITYYSHGTIVTCGDISYLVVYSRDDLAVDRADLPKIEGDAVEKQLAWKIRYALKDNSELSLSLLNLRSTDLLKNIHSFDAKTEISDPKQLSDMLNKYEIAHSRSKIQSDLRQIGLAIMMYVQDNNETYPQAATWLSAINLPQGIIETPITHQKFLYNVSLSGKGLGSIQDPTVIIMVYEPASESDGKRCAAFVDGHVQYLDAPTWAKLAKLSGITN